jgi:hypothetical protein
VGKKMGITARFVARHTAAAAVGAVGALIYVEVRDLLRWLKEERVEAGTGETL